MCGSEAHRGTAGRARGRAGSSRAGHPAGAYGQRRAKPRRGKARSWHEGQPGRTNATGRPKQR
eukprot:5416879-Alexandrium_andersonii.AAC.1